MPAPPDYPRRPESSRAQFAANHARVLDFFRSVDTNFDGVISRGEMHYAMHSLGLNASPKEVDQLFEALAANRRAGLALSDGFARGARGYTPIGTSAQTVQI